MSDPGLTSRSVGPRLWLFVAGLSIVAGCVESVVQIDPDDVVRLRVSLDSAGIMVGRTLDLDAFPLDADGTLLVGQAVSWSSSDVAVASVDEDGLVTGVTSGTASVVAQLFGLRDTTFVTVAPPPALALAADSVGFDASAGGASPAPDSVLITNAGSFDLIVSVDSIVYLSGAAGWLTAVLDGAVAPVNLILTPSSAGVTGAGTSRALVWVSGADADGSPASVEATLRVTAGNAATIAINDGNNQSRTVGLAVTTAPSVLVRDAYSNPAVGATVTFAVTGGGGQLTGGSAVVDGNGVARVGSWTLGTTAGSNQLTASLGILTPVVFTATGTPAGATQVVTAGGNNQSAVAGSAVGVAPSVSVRDQFGNGVSGVSVTFAVTSGGGSITGASQTSGVGGVATVGSWTLGSAAGSNTLSATAAGVGTPAVVTATGISGAADTMFATAGNAQTDTVAATLPVGYAVRIVDSNGNGVAGIPVTWTVTFGGGSITPLDTTDAQGYATAVRVLGTVPGADSATAVVGGVPGSPVRYSATATVGSPAAITISAGNAQSDTVNQIVPIAPQVRVADKFNNPIQNHLVTFAVTAGGGAVVPTTPIATLANGTATVTSWRLGTTAGPNRDTLTATASGGGITGNPVRFAASSVAGPPTSIAVVQGGTPQQTAITGTAVSTTPTVVVRDAFSNAVSGRTVTFAPSGSGAVGSPAPVTGPTGQAATSWTVNVGGHAMGTDGTFQNTLTAAVQGTALSTAFTAFARYSYAIHVDSLWIQQGCTGCHDENSANPSAGLGFGWTASLNRSRLANVTLTCDVNGTLGPQGYRRVSTAGGVAAADTYSLLMRYLDPNIADQVGTCGPHTGGTPFAAGAAELTRIRAWIRNGAPNN